jgi:hypothetical protein
MMDGGASRSYRAYCIRFDDDTSVAWSHNESFSVSGYKKLTLKQIKIVAGPNTHVLRRDEHGDGDDDTRLGGAAAGSGDPKKPPPRLTSLRALAMDKTRDQVFRWTKDGLRLEQHAQALQHEITTLRADHSRMSGDYQYAVSRYDESRLDARERTQAMKDQASMQRDITSAATKLRQQQVLYRQVAGEKLKTLSLKGLRAAIGSSTKLRRNFEAALRAYPLNGRFCDELFRVVWSLENLAELNFRHLRAPPLEAGLIAWLLNDWRTQVRGLAACMRACVRA